MGSLSGHPLHRDNIQPNFRDEQWHGQAWTSSIGLTGQLE